MKTSVADLKASLFEKQKWKRRALPIATALIGAFALLLLILLSVASSNTQFFDNYFIWLYAANVVIGICLTLVILTLVVVIAIRWHKGRFGTRLIAKLAMIFALVGVVPGLILYGVSLQFVSRSIETWFDVKVESALEAGLELGRATLRASLQELQDDGRMVVDQIQALPNHASPAELALLLSRLRDQLGVLETTLKFLSKIQTPAVKFPKTVSKNDLDSCREVRVSASCRVMTLN